MNGGIVTAVFARTWAKSLRRPIHFAFSLAQPLLWLLFFGLLMQRFPADLLPQDVSYPAFLLPGIAAMTVLFGASQSGISLIRDLQTGMLQRVLTSSAPPWTLHLGKVLADGSRLLLQALVVLAAGVAIGIPVSVSWSGLLIGFAALFLFGVAFASLSCWVALLAKRQEALAAFVHLVNMPVFFTSTALLPRRQMPEWLANVAAYNPLSLAVDAMRDATLFERVANPTETLVPLAVAALLFFAAASRQMTRAAATSSWETR